MDEYLSDVGVNTEEAETTECLSPVYDYEPYIEDHLYKRKKKEDDAVEGKDADDTSPPADMHLESYDALSMAGQQFSTSASRVTTQNRQMDTPVSWSPGPLAQLPRVYGPVVRNDKYKFIRLLSRHNFLKEHTGRISQEGREHGCSQSAVVMHNRDDVSCIPACQCSARRTALPSPSIKPAIDHVNEDLREEKRSSDLDYLCLFNVRFHLGSFPSLLRHFFASFDHNLNLVDLASTVAINTNHLSTLAAECTEFLSFTSYYAQTIMRSPSSLFSQSSNIHERSVFAANLQTYVTSSLIKSFKVVGHYATGSSLPASSSSSFSSSESGMRGPCVNVDWKGRHAALLIHIRLYMCVLEWIALGIMDSIPIISYQYVKKLDDKERGDGNPKDAVCCHSVESVVPCVSRPSTEATAPALETSKRARAFCRSTPIAHAIQAVIAHMLQSLKRISPPTSTTEAPFDQLYRVSLLKSFNPAQFYTNLVRVLVLLLHSHARGKTFGVDEQSLLSSLTSEADPVSRLWKRFVHVTSNHRWRLSAQTKNDMHSVHSIHCPHSPLFFLLEKPTGLKLSTTIGKNSPVLSSASSPSGAGSLSTTAYYVGLHAYAVQEIASLGSDAVFPSATGSCASPLAAFYAVAHELIDECEKRTGLAADMRSFAEDHILSNIQGDEDDDDSDNEKNEEQEGGDDGDFNYEEGDISYDVDSYSDLDDQRWDCRRADCTDSAVATVLRDGIAVTSRHTKVLGENSHRAKRKAYGERENLVERVMFSKRGINLFHFVLNSGEGVLCGEGEGGRESGEATGRRSKHTIDESAWLIQSMVASLTPLIGQAKSPAAARLLSMQTCTIYEAVWASLVLLVVLQETVRREGPDRGRPAGGVVRSAGPLRMDVDTLHSPSSGGGKNAFFVDWLLIDRLLRLECSCFPSCPTGGDASGFPSPFPLHKTKSLELLDRIYRVAQLVGSEASSAGVGGTNSTGPRRSESVATLEDLLFNVWENAYRCVSLEPIITSVALCNDTEPSLVACIPKLPAFLRKDSSSKPKAAASSSSSSPSVNVPSVLSSPSAFDAFLRVFDAHIHFCIKDLETVSAEVSSFAFSIGCAYKHLNKKQETKMKKITSRYAVSLPKGPQVIRHPNDIVFVSPTAVPTEGKTLPADSPPPSLFGLYKQMCLLLCLARYSRSQLRSMCKRMSELLDVNTSSLCPRLVTIQGLVGMLRLTLSAFSATVNVESDTAGLERGGPGGNEPLSSFSSSTSSLSSTSSSSSSSSSSLSDRTARLQSEAAQLSAGVIKATETVEERLSEVSTVLSTLADHINPIIKQYFSVRVQAGKLEGQMALLEAKKGELHRQAKQKRTALVMPAGSSVSSSAAGVDLLRLVQLGEELRRSQQETSNKMKAARHEEDELERGLQLVLGLLGHAACEFKKAQKKVLAALIAQTHTLYCKYMEKEECGGVEACIAGEAHDGVTNSRREEALFELLHMRLRHSHSQVNVALHTWLFSQVSRKLADLLAPSASAAVAASTRAAPHAHGTSTVSTFSAGLGSTDRDHDMEDLVTFVLSQFCRKCTSVATSAGESASITPSFNGLTCEVLRYTAALIPSQSLYATPLFESSYKEFVGTIRLKEEQNESKRREFLASLVHAEQELHAQKLVSASVAKESAAASAVVKVEEANDKDEEEDEDALLLAQCEAAERAYALQKQQESEQRQCADDLRCIREIKASVDACIKVMSKTVEDCMKNTRSELEKLAAAVFFHPLASTPTDLATLLAHVLGVKIDLAGVAAMSSPGAHPHHLGTGAMSPFPFAAWTSSECSLRGGSSADPFRLAASAVVDLLPLVILFKRRDGLHSLVKGVGPGSRFFPVLENGADGTGGASLGFPVPVSRRPFLRGVTYEVFALLVKAAGPQATSRFCDSEGDHRAIESLFPPHLLHELNKGWVDAMYSESINVQSNRSYHALVDLAFPRFAADSFSRAMVSSSSYYFTPTFLPCYHALMTRLLRRLCYTWEQSCDDGGRSARAATRVVHPIASLVFVGQQEGSPQSRVPSTQGPGLAISEVECPLLTSANESRVLNAFLLSSCEISSEAGAKTDLFRNLLAHPYFKLFFFFFFLTPPKTPNGSSVVGGKSDCEALPSLSEVLIAGSDKDLQENRLFILQLFFRSLAFIYQRDVACIRRQATQAPFDGGPPSATSSSTSAAAEVRLLDERYRLLFSHVIEMFSAWIQEAQEGGSASSRIAFVYEALALILEHCPQVVYFPSAAARSPSSSTRGGGERKLSSFAGQYGHILDRFFMPENVAAQQHALCLAASQEKLPSLLHSLACLFDEQERREIVAPISAGVHPVCGHFDVVVSRVFSAFFGGLTGDPSDVVQKKEEQMLKRIAEGLSGLPFSSFLPEISEATRRDVEHSVLPVLQKAGLEAVAEENARELLRSGGEGVEVSIIGIEDLASRSAVGLGGARKTSSKSLKWRELLLSPRYFKAALDRSPLPAPAQQIADSDSTPGKVTSSTQAPLFASSPVLQRQTGKFLVLVASSVFHRYITLAVNTQRSNSRSFKQALNSVRTMGKIYCQLLENIPQQGFQAVSGRGVRIHYVDLPCRLFPVACLSIITPAVTFLGRKLERSFLSALKLKECIYTYFASLLCEYPEVHKDGGGISVSRTEEVDARISTAYHILHVRAFPACHDKQCICCSYILSSPPSSFPSTPFTSSSSSSSSSSPTFRPASSCVEAALTLYLIPTACNDLVSLYGSGHELDAKTEYKALLDAVNHHTKMFVQERYFVGNTSEQYKLISTMLSCSSNVSVISDSAAVDSAHFDEEIDSFPYPEKDAPALKSGLVKAAFKLLSTCLLWQKRRAPSLEEASGSAFKDGPLNELRSAIVRLDGRRRSEAAD